MIWAFTIGGAVIGAIAFGGFGFVVLGFVGWLLGLIVKSMKQPMPGTAPTPAATTPKVASASSKPASIDGRVATLEARVAELEKRLGVEAAAIVEAAPVVAAPPAEPVAEAVAAPVEAPPPLPASAPRPPPPPPKPAEPNFLVKWLTGGNTIVRVGVVILFFGLAFLVKYGVEHDMVPVELRVAGVALAGLIMLILGWRLRRSREGYALTLQGAGIATLYLTIFGALRLYHLVPAGFAFVLLALIAAFSAFLAIAQDSLALAVIGAAGGFLAPILASTGGGSHVMLFSYYLVLNAGIVAIAWYRAWRVLNLVGFLFTFLIGLAWGMRSYKDELFGTTEPFLVAFFLTYVAVAIFFARKQKDGPRNVMDGMLVFGNPAAAFGLQAVLIREFEYGLAFSSIVMGAMYMVLAAILMRAKRERWSFLAEAFLSLGTVFATLAIPLALDARWTSAAWALEGAAVVWIGVRQGRPLARAFGILLQVLAGIAFLKAVGNMSESYPLVNPIFVGTALLSIAGLWSNRLLGRLVEPKPQEKVVRPLLFLWGMFWWVFAGIHETDEYVATQYQFGAALAFLAATPAVFTWIDAKIDWREARWPLRALPVAMLLATILVIVEQANPGEDFAWAAWIFAFTVHFNLLRRPAYDVQSRWFTIMHSMGIVTLATVGALQLEWLAGEYTAKGTAWALASRIVVPSVVLLAMASETGRSRWPVAQRGWAYLVGGGVTLTVMMALWSLHVNFSHGGGSDPLPYLPLLNALDLGHILAIIAVTSLWFGMRRAGIGWPGWLGGRFGIVAAAGVIFLWLNSALLRTIHHWADIPYHFGTMSSSVLVQASLSVFWAFLALAAMIYATRSARRALWMTGGGLMAVVVVKLVLVDLSHLSGIERIVSFIGVGVLMLVIGYFSPVPPRKKEEVTA